MNVADSITKVFYAPSISRRDSTSSIKGRMPSSLEIRNDSSSRDTALAPHATTVGELAAVRIPFPAAPATSKWRTAPLTRAASAIARAANMDSMLPRGVIRMASTRRSN